jgi:hypothetical protein
MTIGIRCPLRLVPAVAGSLLEVLTRLPLGVLTLLMLMGDRCLAVDQQNGVLAVGDRRAIGVVRISAAATGDDAWPLANACVRDELGEALTTRCPQGSRVATTFHIELYHRVPPISPRVQS